MKYLKEIDSQMLLYLLNCDYLMCTVNSQTLIYVTRYVSWGPNPETVILADEVMGMEKLSFGPHVSCRHTSRRSQSYLKLYLLGSELTRTLEVNTRRDKVPHPCDCRGPHILQCSLSSSTS